MDPFSSDMLLVSKTIRILGIPKPSIASSIRKNILVCLLLSAASTNFETKELTRKALVVTVIITWLFRMP